MDTTDFERMEQTGWSDPSIAKGYADGFAVATVVVADALAEAVDARRGKHVLDMCTGHGVVAGALLARGATVTGLDFSPAMIALARQAAPQATFVQGDAMAMAFDDHSFDAITIGFGVPHLPDPARGLGEAARVLQPGGRIAFSIWRGKGSHGAFGWLFDAVDRLGDPDVQLPTGPDAHMFANRDIAEPVLTEQGFTDVHVNALATSLWVPAPEALFDAFDQGAVRAASLLGGQSDNRRAAIRADLADRARTLGTARDGGYLVAAPSVVISATRA